MYFYVYALHLLDKTDLFGNTYGFSPGFSGLAYIGLGIGFFAATLFGARFADQVYQLVCFFFQFSARNRVHTFATLDFSLAFCEKQRSRYP